MRIGYILYIMFRRCSVYTPISGKKRAHSTQTTHQSLYNPGPIRSLCILFHAVVAPPRQHAAEVAAHQEVPNRILLTQGDQAELTSEI